VISSYINFILTLTFYFVCSSVAAIVFQRDYNAVNEPICMYDAGTDERAQLDAALKRLNSTVYDVPVVVGDEEIRSGEPLLQPKVLTHIYIDDCRTRKQGPYSRNILKDFLKIFLG